MNYSPLLDIRDFGQFLRALLMRFLAEAGLIHSLIEMGFDFGQNIRVSKF